MIDSLALFTRGCSLSWCAMGQMAAVDWFRVLLWDTVGYHYRWWLFLCRWVHDSQEE